MMYESPVNLYEIDNIISDITKKVENDTETYVMQSIRRVGVDVDKDELIKALQYDRDQYNKGYANAKAEIREKMLAQAFQVVNPENTYEYINVISVDAFNDLFSGGEDE